ncbi:response regulator [Fulvivirga kasyanovii]|uniref:Response regulator n=1 Tax=Fulvivirga kasyanovii TaxID=396812 RepID=A0ABW9RYR7_9BACT|nr:response regulator [Fulvivirga kasyanovii]MTI29091.1 response regulator [Fulvivirga kasyanovii]
MKKSTQFKLFVVDDDPFYINLFAFQLSKLGYENVTTFSSGVACLENLDQKPDVVFLDHNMDTYSGYEVLKKIKRYDPNIYVVMISAQEEIKTAVDALKHGAFDYIQKGDNETKRIKSVLIKIHEVKELLEHTRPTIFKKLFQFL